MPGMYAEDTIQRVKEASDIVEIIGAVLELKRSGSTYKCICPFHNDHKPSMTVNPAMQIYKCFSCGAGGNVFTFMTQYHRMTFPEAVKALADRANISIEQAAGYDPAAAARDREARDSLEWLNSQSAQWFEEQLYLPSGREALEYLRGRGFTDGTIRAWRLGWAPDSPDAFRAFLMKKTGEKWPRAEKAAVEAGLLRERDNGGTYAFFRARVMFPINDERGRPIAFGGRILKEDPNRPVGKYLNTPETPLFSKSRVLFGLDAAHREIRTTGSAVVVEGYTDVIMCHQHGLRNVIATLGTALTPEHVKILKRHARRVIARFDADEAGSRATDRAIRVFMEADMPLSIVRAQGAAKDACEFLPKHGADAYRAAYEDAPDAFRYILRQMIESANLRNLDEKAAAVHAVMEVANLSPDPVKREMMRNEVALTANVPVDSLPVAAPKPQRAPDRVAAHDAPRPGADPARAALPLNATSGSPRLVIEKELLGYMAVNRAWCDRICAVVPPEDFSCDAFRDIASEVHDAWQRPGALALAPADLLVHLPDEKAARLVTDLFMRDGDERTDERLSTTLHRALMCRVEEERSLFMQELREAQGAADAARVAAVCASLMNLDQELERLKTEFQTLLDDETLRS